MLLTAPCKVLISAIFVAGAASWALSPSTALAGGGREDIPHVVRPGDTLEGIAKSYLAAPRYWKILQTHNKVSNPQHLRLGSVVWIPSYLQPEVSSSVDFVYGEVNVQPPSQRVHHDSTPPIGVRITAGSKLSEGSLLEVGPDSFVAVRLADGSIVRVGAQSKVQLRQLRRRGRQGSLQSVLEVQRGSVESSVTPSNDASRRFEVRTPRAVTSVRGTRFGVTLNDGGRTTAVVFQGAVSVETRSAESSVPGRTSAVMLQPNQGLVVQADGTMGSPHGLLPAPDLKTMPKVLHEPGILALDVPEQPGANAYQALVARDAEMTQVLRSGLFLSGHIHWPALEDGPYFISVRALDAEGIAGMPAIQKLIIKTQPVPPFYQQPASGGILSSVGGQLQCTQVPGVRWYRIQVAANADFTPPLLDESRQETCKLSFDSLAVGNYFWRAASVLELANGQIDQGPFAPPQPFTVMQQPVTPLAQAMQVSDGDTAVSLRWPAENGQRFRLQLATESGFENPVLDITLNENIWAASDLDTGTYFVRIQVLDASGLQSDFSAPRSIRVNGGLDTDSGLAVKDTSGQAVRRP